MRKLPMMGCCTYPEGLYHRDDLRLSLQQTDAEISRLLRENHDAAQLRAAITRLLQSENVTPSGGRASAGGLQHIHAGKESYSCGEAPVKNYTFRTKWLLWKSRRPSFFIFPSSSDRPLRSTAR